MKANIQKILILLSFASFFISCGKEENSPVPYVIVDLNVPIINYRSLNGGNVEKITNPACGYLNHGIIVAPYGSAYYAYDATCTNDISHALTVDSDNYTATCSKCKITYNLLGANNGFAKDNAAPRLKQYRAYTTNNGTRLVVKN